ncbi:MAG: bifunctional acetate--CoA ligase family protein/GNAT family N-acetyltransferase [Planctomyces sp.]|nr:bifunctional acetate--CoA ligase family protein/GNAT family N-acetyltransferase [Planctomyces sp.]
MPVSSGSIAAGRRRDPLDAIFFPRSIAVIGASEQPGSVGRTVLANLLANGPTDRVYPVNLKRPSVLGQTAFPEVAVLPETPDLAVIVTPAAAVPGIVEQCGARGIPGAIIISAGFKELGEAGAELETRSLSAARKFGMRIIGPNCLGVMNPVSNVNATFAHGMAKRGRMAFLSQSGALCTAILDWSQNENVGFSAFVSVGSMLDIGWADLIDYYGRDPETDSLLLYMESVGNARSFLSAAREVALSKPIVVIKGGRTAEASQAAASHTGSLAGSDVVFDAALRRVGVLRVDQIAELFLVAEFLSKQPRPAGRRLTIVTNAGGPGVLATDALVQGGGQLAPLSDATRTALNELLPPHWSRANPIDVLGDADADRYAKTLEIVAADPETDGLLVILTPQDMTDADGTAAKLCDLSRPRNKPLFTSWMGGPAVAAANELLNAASIPTFSYPDTAARIFNHLWKYSEQLNNLYETPARASDPQTVRNRIQAAGQVIAQAREVGRTLLTEYEAKEVLKAYGIPTTPTEIATTADEAVAAARQLGFPVVVKLHSFSITHKTDIGGVRLNLSSDEDVRSAFNEIARAVAAHGPADAFAGVTVQPMISADGYEIILGSSLDPQFGPVILFGSGGVLVEVYRDSAVGLPPLNTTLARRLMERTKIDTALKGVRGRPPVDLPRLEQIVATFSELAIEQPLIQECDINPLRASAERIIALDARIVLHPQDRPVHHIPVPAIRPYPIQYVRSVELPEGVRVTFRPIRLEDEPLMIRFHEALSEDSVHNRYFALTNVAHRTDHRRLIRVCYSDFDAELAMIVQPEGAHEIVAVGRLSRAHRAPVAEFALIVADAWQKRGIGRRLLAHLLDVAAEEGVQRVVGYILPTNARMLQVCAKLGFSIEDRPDERLVRVSRDVQCTSAAPAP